MSYRQKFFWERRFDINRCFVIDLRLFHICSNCLKYIYAHFFNYFRFLPFLVTLNEFLLSLFSNRRKKHVLLLRMQLCTHNAFSSISHSPRPYFYSKYCFITRRCFYYLHRFSEGFSRSTFLQFRAFVLNKNVTLASNPGIIVPGLAFLDFDDNFFFFFLIKREGGLKCVRGKFE